MARNGAAACCLIELVATVEGGAVRGIGRGGVAVKALSSLLKVAGRTGVEAVEGAVPTALATTTIAAGAVLVGVGHSF